MIAYIVAVLQVGEQGNEEAGVEVHATNDALKLIYKPGTSHNFQGERHKRQGTNSRAQPLRELMHLRSSARGRLVLGGKGNVAVLNETCKNRLDRICLNLRGGGYACAVYAPVASLQCANLLTNEMISIRCDQIEKVDERLTQ